jgi:hypothetical protein
METAQFMKHKCVFAKGTHSTGKDEMEPRFSGFRDFANQSQVKIAYVPLRNRRNIEN